MSLLSVKDLSITYRTDKGEFQAASGINLEVNAGEMTAIVGESGSGKSTSAMAAIGLLPENASIVSGSIFSMAAMSRNIRRNNGVNCVVDASL